MNTIIASNTTIVCDAIVNVVLIVVAGFLLWKLMDHIANNKSAHYKRRCDEEDKDRKQQAELLNKYLDFLKEQTKDQTADAEKTKPDKPDKTDKTEKTDKADKTGKTDKPVKANTADINRYREVLESLVGLSKNNKPTETSNK